MPLLTLNSTLRNTTSPSSLWNNTRRQEEKNLKGVENVLLLFFFILRLHENCISKPVKSFSIREPHHKAIRKIGRDLKCLFHFVLHQNKQTAWSLWIVSHSYCSHCACESQQSFKKILTVAVQLCVQTIARATFAFMDDHQPGVTVSTWKELIRELYFILIYGQIVYK